LSVGLEPDFGSFTYEKALIAGQEFVKVGFADPSLSGYYAAVVADTKHPQVNVVDADRLVTLVGRFPRSVLAEFNTHRVFSRNSASSRARNVKSVVEGVLNDPYVPLFTENTPGMSGRFIQDGVVAQRAREDWLAARDSAVESFLMVLMGLEYDPDLSPGDNLDYYYENIYKNPGVSSTGVHKQDVNRLLEPFMWHEVVFTSAHWENFFTLRCDFEYTYIPFYAFAVLVREALRCSTPEVSEYHTPFLTTEEKSQLTGDMKADQALLMKSSSVAANISYRDAADTQASIRLGERLLDAGHMSPFEHVAYASTDPGVSLGGNLGDLWDQYRRFLETENNNL
jgi:putative thymidylate synthase, flavin-dependent